jgi:hypothetical protein
MTHTEMQKQYTKIEFSKTIVPLIEMFNMCPVDNEASTSGVSVYDVITLGIQKGYLVDPKCANNYAHAFLSGINIKYNSTFYKSWGDVTNKTRLDLFVDQVMHYMTTYGTDFSLETSYIPNVYTGEPALNTYKVIKSCTYLELYNKCLDMLTSGIALKSITVKVITDYMIQYLKLFPGETILCVDGIKNREALVILCDTFGILPKDGAKMFAHIMYKATGLTMIIKNRETRKMIRNSIDKPEVISLFKNLNDKQLRALASVFNRYKKLFVAFKSKETNNVINKISRYSKTCHKPMIRGYWENILHYNPDYVMKTIEAEAEKATNFKLIQVMQSIRERFLLAVGMGDTMYVIRNGKVFVANNYYTSADVLYHKWNDIYEVCRTQLIKNLRAKACTVRFPEKYELVCPTSEKNFIGDFPMGTSCNITKDTVVGIYWRNDWGTRDFDLSYTDIDGNRIAWNGDYYSKDKFSVVYSGDITDAPDGANELIYFKDDTIPNGIVNINRYNGNAGSKYKLFFGNEVFKDLHSMDMQNYMIDPNRVILQSEVTQGESSQQTIGMVFDGKFYFYSLSCGNSKVSAALRRTISRRTNKSVWDNSTSDASSKELVEILKRKAISTVSLKEILLEAGFVEAIDLETPKLDLTTIDRSTLIDLFSK